MRTPKVVPSESHDKFLLAPVGSEAAATSYKLSFEVDGEQS